MSNRAHDHLHRLIRSMTAAEKRYFKLHASRHMKWGRGNQQLLFDAIGAMAVYDETALLARYKGHPFTRSFAIVKRRLYEAILGSLEVFHAGSSVDARLRRRLHQVEILHRRALYDEARRMLVGVRKLARAHDRSTVLQEVLAWERRWLERTGYSGTTNGALQHMADESRSLHDASRELDELWEIKSRIFLLLYSEGRVRDAAHVQALRRLSAHPLLRNIGQLRSVRARFMFHHIHGALAYVKNDLRTCEHHLAEGHALLLRYRRCFAEEPNLLFSVLGNRIHACIRAGRYRQAEHLLREFKELPLLPDARSSADLELKVFATSTSLELDLLIQRGTFGQALTRVPAIEREFAHREAHLNAVRKEGLFFQLACVHFGAGNFLRAHHWTHRLLNEKGGARNSELQLHGRFLDLLILLELGKYDLLPYTLRSAKRFFDRKKYAVGHALIACLREHLTARRGDRRVALERFRDAMTAEGADRDLRPLFEHIHVLAWIESRLSGRPFAQVLQERLRPMSEAA